jgi:hypothetical protein
MQGKQAKIVSPIQERGGRLSPATVRLWFHRLYISLKMEVVYP